MSAKFFSKSLLIGFALTLAGCGVNSFPQNPNQTMADEPSANGSMHVYFTSPQENSGCEILDPLISSIQAAEDSIQLAMYNLNLEVLADALIAAQARGVDVFVVMDNEKTKNQVPQFLLDAGISLVSDPADSTMHNKFMVIDSKQVWTGSMNFTASGCEEDYNHLIQIESPELAKNYQMEFDEMFEDRAFSTDSPKNTPYPVLNISGVQVHTLFSPEDGVQDALLNEISKADESIVFLAYSFTSDKLAKALEERAKAGVEVIGVMDAEQIRSNTGGEYENMLEAGISIAQDDIPGQMHHKVIILDENIVVTGSYNFSGNAEKRNDENVLILYSPDLAREFLQEYSRIKTR